MIVYFAPPSGAYQFIFGHFKLASALRTMTSSAAAAAAAVEDGVGDGDVAAALQC